LLGGRVRPGEERRAGRGGEGYPESDVHRNSFRNRTVSKLPPNPAAVNLERRDRRDRRVGYFHL